MKKKTYIWMIPIACVVLLMAVVAAERYRSEVCNYISYDGEGHGYYVYPDMDADSLLACMEQDYELANRVAWRMHARYWAYTQPKPGYYRFPARVGDRHLIKRLRMGEQTPVKLTFTKNIRTPQQLAGVLGKQLLVDSATIWQHLDSVPFMAHYGMNKATAVCLFIPNTYEVYWTISVRKLFDRMYKEYRHFWNEERLAAASAKHLTPEEVYTLASIVESESNMLSDYPHIASLYLNRLRKRMPLQACPTVIFAVGDFSIRRVLKRHLKYDSPYNTYRYAGLPPGPIRLARGVAIDAVLQAPQTDYLYMCANPDFKGGHIFSSSYAHHAKAARAYQKAFTQRQKQL